MESVYTQVCPEKTAAPLLIATFLSYNNYTFMSLQRIYAAPTILSQPRFKSNTEMKVES